MTIPIVTSIPPALSRRSRDGREIGEEYGRACVDSWVRCGFAPISVNARRESGAADFPSAVRRVEVEEDASTVTGKPLVFLRDVLRAACAASAGPVAVVNADIILDPAAMESVRALKRGEALAVKRIDIAAAGELRGAQYANGFDFFAFHGADVEALADSGMVFGAPWWDHYLPLAMLVCGSRLALPPRPVAFHLVHEQRWSWDVWQTMGERFVEAMRATLDGSARGGPLVGDYVEGLERALRGEGAPFRLPILPRAPWKALDRKFLALMRVSDENIRFLDALAPGADGR